MDFSLGKIGIAIGIVGTLILALFPQSRHLHRVAVGLITGGGLIEVAGPTVSAEEIEQAKDAAQRAEAASRRAEEAQRTIEALRATEELQIANVSPETRPLTVASLTEEVPNQMPDLPTRSASTTPRVAVIAVGEATLATAAEEQIQRRLGSLTQFELVDERPLIGGRLPDGVPLPLEQLAGAGADIVVVAQADFLSGRELNYYGRTSIATSARLNVSAIRLADAKPLGPGWSEPLEYTSINVDDKTRAVISRIEGDLIDHVRGGWR